MIERGVVKKLHHAINEALERVGNQYGFKYATGGMRFSDIDVTGKMKFILESKLPTINKASEQATGFVIGETVTVGGKPMVEYEVTGYTGRNASKIGLERLTDGKKFRANPSVLVHKEAA